MKILQQNAGLLSNAEVLSVLADRGCVSDALARPLVCEKIVHQNLAAGYARVNVPDRDGLHRFYEAVKPFDLTRIEVGRGRSRSPRGHMQYVCMSTWAAHGSSSSLPHSTGAAADQPGALAGR